MQRQVLEQTDLRSQGTFVVDQIVSAAMCESGGDEAMLMTN